MRIISNYGHDSVVKSSYLKQLLIREILIVPPIRVSLGPQVVRVNQGSLTADIAHA